MIYRAFLVTAIANKMDGSEDELFEVYSNIQQNVCVIDNDLLVDKNLLVNNESDNDIDKTN